MREYLRGIYVLVAAGVVIFVVVLPLTLMAVFGVGWFQRSTANFRGETKAIEQTRANANFRLSSYNRFFDLCSSIQGDEARITAQESLLNTGTPEDQQRARTNVAAIQGSRAAKINRYNADATKDFTVGQFRDNKLPYQINLEGTTTCAA